MWDDAGEYDREYTEGEFEDEFEEELNDEIGPKGKSKEKFGAPEDDDLHEDEEGNDEDFDDLDDF